MTTSNPFAAALADAARQGYIGSGRRSFTSTGGVRVERNEVRVPVKALISERQHSYAVDLLDKRNLAAETRPAWRDRLVELCADVYRNGGAMLWELDRTQASALIDCLTALPVRERAPLSPAQQEVAAQPVSVPAGRYAVEIGETLAFVQVDRPEEGRWAGYTFVTRQLADDFVRVSRQQAAAILDAIAAVGPAEASKRYGREIGECGVCHRTLTNEDSRAAGIGPQCAKKIGW